MVATVFSRILHNISFRSSLSGNSLVVWNNSRRRMCLGGT
jgi:hypothetical protein